MLMTNDELLDFIVGAAMTTMDVTGEHQPTLIIEDRSDEMTVCVLAGGHPYEVLLRSTPIIREMHPIRISFTTDAYGTTLQPEDRGGLNLAAMFAQGDPRVYEALQFLIVSPETETGAMLRYTRTDDGIEWGEAQNDGLSFGRMVEALRECLS